jgi:hypothetical protein
MKQCFKCKNHKPLTDFNIDKRTNKPRSYCKQCNNQINKTWRLNNLQKAKDQNKKHQLSFKLKNLYNITESHLSLLYKKADNKCMICQKKKKLYIDHDHQTNKVRGLLCSKCNLGLGHFNDDIETLISAIYYLSE